MKYTFLTTLGILLIIHLSAQVTRPEGFAYSRKTIPGIADEHPEGGKTAQNKNPFPDSFYLFVSVPSGTNLSISGVWLKGQYFSANMQQIHTPVLVTQDNVFSKSIEDTLVKAGSGVVYQIFLDTLQSKIAGQLKEQKLKTQNEAVFLLNCNGTPCSVPVHRIKTLHPYSAM